MFAACLCSCTCASCSILLLWRFYFKGTRKLLPGPSETMLSMQDIMRMKDTKRLMQFRGQFGKWIWVMRWACIINPSATALCEEPWGLKKWCNQSCLFTKNHARAITLPFLSESGFFHLWIHLSDIYFVYGFIWNEIIVPVWRSGVGKQSFLRLEQHMAWALPLFQQ